MAKIYDGVFRTAVNDCKGYLIPLINEVFDEHFSGDEEIVFHPNEHFLSHQDKPDSERITDTNFTVMARFPKNYHLECESSHYSRKISIRLFEYAAQIALDGGRLYRNTLTVTFPHTAVIYLRSTQKTPDKLDIVIKTPGGSATYEVPVVKLTRYSLDELFEKKLYLLLPFYIFSYERELAEYNTDEGKMEHLKQQYVNLIERLERLVEKGDMTSFDKETLLKLSHDVIQQLAKKHENVRKGLGELMVGTLIETEARKIRDEGISLGISEGLRALVNSLSNFLHTPEDILQEVKKNPAYKDVKLEQIKKYYNRQ